VILFIRVSIFLRCIKYYQSSLKPLISVLAPVITSKTSPSPYWIDLF
jgi:hypothetical protein